MDIKSERIRIQKIIDSQKDRIAQLPNYTKKKFRASPEEPELNIPKAKEEHDEKHHENDEKKKKRPRIKH